jgi:trans-2,3-dihydro-3-hydroxyanthranilate isomerase
VALVRKHTAGIIDVFGPSVLTGNPLAVVEDADDLSESEMRLIAREFNQSETTFVLKSDKADVRLRSFTSSGIEVFGAGHNALGAWLWLGFRGMLGTLEVPKEFAQEIGGIVFPVVVHARNGAVYGSMTQRPLRLGPELRAIHALAASLGLAEEDILRDPPPRAADTGAAHLMVRARDRDTVDRAEPAHSALRQVLRDAAAEGCYLYALDERARDLAYARFFNPTVGLWEDPATGTAAGPLAAYLGMRGMLKPNLRLEVEQGTRMGRRSILSVTLTPEPTLSGTGTVVLTGSLAL